MNIDNLLNKIEKIIGYTLPIEFKEIYLHSEDKNMSFMSLEEIYDELVSAIDDTLAYSNLYTSNPDNSILLKSFDKKRLPFMTLYTGDYIGLDFNPGEEGILGQIINYGTDIYDMRVISYTFKDFIKGIKDNYCSEEGIAELLDKDISFITKKEADLNIVEIKSENLIDEEITETKIHEIIKEKNVTISNLDEIINILTQMNIDIKNNENVIEFKNYWFNYRIINKRDSLSRTMQDRKNFYLKLEDYAKEEIKGFSFAITNFIKEKCQNKLLRGEEKIFVEINILANTVLIRYTETLKNINMKTAYESICNYIDSLI